ncbi:MAG TPA: YSC84-related protein [bacterium]|nr:YSC84-related protein [bacterium]
MMSICLSVFSSAALALPAFLDRRPAEKQRKQILERSAEILEKLYKAEPQAKASVEGAHGYATFSNFGVKIFLAGSGTGRGIAVNNKTQEKTFMNMAEIQAGLGLGIKKFILVWVFETEQAFDKFVNSGWELGGQASAAAKAGGKGGSLQGATQVASGIWVYQLTDAGLALELTAKGTKYYKDNDLNKSTAEDDSEKDK